MATVSQSPLSVEEVLRLHSEAQQRKPQQQDAALRRLKAEHLKARGDDAIKQGNYREAWERYKDALEVHPDKAALPALHSNRSLAFHKAGRYGEALQDADAAARLAPGWHKAHWRRATTLLALRRAPEAVLAYRDAWQLASGTRGSGGKGGGSAGNAEAAECEARLWAAVQRLTREQLGRGMLCVLRDMQEEGQLEAPAEEEASEQELAESMFRLIKDAHQGKPRPGPCYSRYLKWLQQGVQPGEAYAERSAVHAGAKCYLQARADAWAAVVALRAQLAELRQEDQKQGRQEAGAAPAGPAQHAASFDAVRSQLAQAYQRLGQAHLAERDHADRDCRGAAKAFLRALELGDGGLEGLQEELQQATEGLTLEEMNQVEMEVYNEGSADGSSPSSGTADAASSGRTHRRFRLVLRLAFPAARAADCSFRARELLRGAVAAAAGVDVQAATIEQVAAPTAGKPHLSILMHVNVGSELVAAGRLARAVNGEAVQQVEQGDEQRQMQEARQTEAQQVDSNQQEGQEPASIDAESQQAGQGQEQDQAHSERQAELASLLGGEALTALLGMPDTTRSGAEIEDVTPGSGAGASEAQQAEQDAINRGADGVDPKKDRRLALPSRPKMELELPYRMYRLVRADGTAVERVDKHPFCMSRVYYDATEKPEEVWTELADGSCRWRQTGGEVKVLALKVPTDLPTRQLGVEIEPYRVKVWNRATGESYLEGDLERGVVPEDCFWTHCGGDGEDGCALYLRKMNLEVLQKHWMHSEMWWPKLFKAHGEIAWDDYEKDYSDLPEEVLQRHRVVEAIKDSERQVETAERTHREVLQERDDLRKRTRQERLNELRSGTKKSWVLLDRELPVA